MTDFLDGIEAILKKADQASQIFALDIRNLEVHVKNTSANYELTHNQILQIERALFALQDYAKSREADPINMLKARDESLRKKAWDALILLHNIFNDAHPSELARDLGIA